MVFISPACFDFCEFSGHNPSVTLGERKHRRPGARAAQTEAARGSRTGRRFPGLCRAPKNGPLQCLSPYIPPRLPASGVSRPLQDSVMSAFFPEEAGGGNLAGEQNPLQHLGWLRRCLWALVRPTWGCSLHLSPSDSCSPGQF